MPNFTRLASDNLDGLSWYENARQDIREVCRSECWDETDFTAILACTSPRCSVRRNVRVAIEYVARGEFLAGTLKSVRRSVDIWRTEGKIHGPKTSAFFRAILGDVKSIVVDVHMANLYGVDARLVRSTKHRSPIEQSVKRVARRISVAPRDAQACLWFAQKRLNGETPTEFPILDEYKNWLAKGRRFPNDGKIDRLTDDDSAVAYPLFATPF